MLDHEGQPLVYQVTYSVEYTLLSGSVVLIPPEVLAQSRNYNYSVTNATSDQEQEEALYGELAHEMAQLIMYRLQAVARNLPPLPSTAAPAATASSPAAATRAAPVAATTQPVLE